jgi:hypothetical protein
MCCRWVIKFAPAVDEYLVDSIIREEMCTISVALRWQLNYILSSPEQLIRQ